MMLALVLIFVMLFPQGFNRNLSPMSPVYIGYAQESHSAALQGQVNDHETGLPIPNALVNVDPLGLKTITGRDGRFAWYSILLPQAVFPITVTITAQGYGSWELQNVRLIDSDTLILHPRLGPQSYLSMVPPPRAKNPDWPPEQEFEITSPQAPLSHLASAPLPKNIRVRVSGWPYTCDTKRAYTVQVLDFKQYAKHVLPNEWDPVWPADSLRAGAMAVKMYAWYLVAIGGKWKDADVWDSTCDQVYNPNFEYASTNAAVNYIWSWVLSRNNYLLPTYYRARYSQCESAGLAGNCMGQWDSKYMADDGVAWQEILYFFYEDTLLSPVTPPPPGGFALRFNGSPGDVNENRVLIPVDDPKSTNPGPPADVGSQDFTIEWWMKASPLDNRPVSITCGENKNWTLGNILLDRDRAGQDRGFGVSLVNEGLAFGVSGEGTGDLTLCAPATITDGRWHHVAVQRRRSDGYMWIYVDGKLAASVDGPDGDVSYPDDAVPTIDTDPFISFGAWKMDDDHNLHPFYRGWLDEIRFSVTVRYTEDFIPIVRAFSPDNHTLALLHLDEGIGNLITDTSGATGGPSHGTRKYGGVINGPEWTVSDLYGDIYLNFLPGTFNGKQAP